MKYFSSKFTQNIYFQLIAFVLSYKVLQFSLEYFIFNAIPLEFFDTDENFDLVNMSVSIILLLSVILAFRYFKWPINIDYLKVKRTGILGIIGIVLALRILNDPIYRIFDIINQLSEYDWMERVRGKSTSSLFLVINTILILPFIEEIIFRGGILGSIAANNGRSLTGVLFSSVLYALIHFGLTSFFSAFTFGIVASVIFLRFGLIYSILFHCLYNLLWVLINYYELYYWKAIAYLNFNIIYWLIVLISVIIISSFLKRNYHKYISM